MNVSPSSFLELYAFDYWANAATLSSIPPETPTDARPLTLFSHILGAQRVWLARIRGEETAGFSVWPAMSAGDCRALLDEMRGEWERFIGSLSEADLGRVVSYRTTRGEPFETPLGEILMHVILHGQYHRAQIASALKADGAVPAMTDYIVYVRR